MTNQWLVIANTTKVYIFTRNLNETEVHLITHMDHAEGKYKGIAFTTDRPGHYKTRETTRGAYSSHTSPREIENDRFAKHIVNFLEKNRTDHRYDSLILILPAHFYGMLLKHLHKPLEQLITQVIQKEILLENESIAENYIKNLRIVNKKIQTEE